MRRLLAILMVLFTAGGCGDAAETTGVGLPAEDYGEVRDNAARLGLLTVR